MEDTISWASLLTAILAGAVRRGTPIAFAALGETLAERSGVINLGVEGLMLIGAMTSIAVQAGFENSVLAVLAAGLAAAFFAAIHAFLTVRLNSNQIVSGFALTVFCLGLSGYLGGPLVGVKISGINVYGIPLLKDIPVLGQIFFEHDPLVYISVLLAFVLWFMMYRTRFGLYVRAVGEDPVAAYAHGVPVRRTRAIAVVLGGFLGGIGGAHLALAYTQLWAPNMTAGQGWMAVGLVIVAGWHPLRALLVSWVFGAVAVLHLHMQAAGIQVPSYLVAMLPYLLSIIALTVMTCRYRKLGHGLPAALMKTFHVNGENG